MAQARMY